MNTYQQCIQIKTEYYYNGPHENFDVEGVTGVEVYFTPNSVRGASRVYSEAIGDTYTLNRQHGEDAYVW